MSEQNETQQNESPQGSSKTVKLDGLFAFKMGMTSIYDENGEAVPVTVLKYEPLFVSQLKTKEKDGYDAVQVACKPKKASRANKSATAKFKAAGFENGAQYVKELRLAPPEGLMIGQRVELGSLAKGDQVRLTGISKGHGFSGVVKRWDFAGGPASHGSGFHRKPGSVGNRTWPGRVIPGKRMAGRWGNDQVTVKNVKVVDVLAEENIVLVKGPVPGARNSLVQLMKA
jgi:large subunit ribosomal protein L3